MRTWGRVQEINRVSNNQSESPPHPDKELLTIRNSERDLAYWHNRSFVSSELRSRIEGAAILLVPQEGFRDYAGPVFPLGTEELFRRAQGKEPAEGPIEVCISDEDYKELALHEFTFIVATVAVASLVVAPIVVNVVSEYLKENFFSPPKEKTITAKFTLIISETSTKDAKRRAIEMKCEGPVDKLEPTFTAKLAEPWSRSCAPRGSGSAGTAGTPAHLRQRSVRPASREARGGRDAGEGVRAAGAWVDAAGGRGGVEG